MKKISPQYFYCACTLFNLFTHYSHTLGKIITRNNHWQCANHAGFAIQTLFNQSFLRETLFLKKKSKLQIWICNSLVIIASWICKHSMCIFYHREITHTQKEIQSLNIHIYSFLISPISVYTVFIRQVVCNGRRREGPGDPYSSIIFRLCYQMKQVIIHAQVGYVNFIDQPFDWFEAWWLQCQISRGKITRWNGALIHY